MDTNFHTYFLMIVGSFLAGYLPQPIIKRIMQHFRKVLHKTEQYQKNSEIIGSMNDHNEAAPIINYVGIVERVVYAGGWLSGYPQIILIIMGMKITPALRDGFRTKVLGMTLFNMYFIGNLLSLISAIFIAETVRLLFILLLF